jgi:hypothetical protein
MLCGCWYATLNSVPQNEQKNPVKETQMDTVTGNSEIVPTAPPQVKPVSSGRTMGTPRVFTGFGSGVEAITGTGLEILKCARCSTKLGLGIHVGPATKCVCLLCATQTLFAK